MDSFILHAIRDGMIEMGAETRVVAEILVRPWRCGKWSAMPGDQEADARTLPHVVEQSKLCCRRWRHQHIPKMSSIHHESGGVARFLGGSDVQEGPNVPTSGKPMSVKQVNYGLLE